MSDEITKEGEEPKAPVEENKAPKAEAKEKTPEIKEEAKKPAEPEEPAIPPYDFENNNVVQAIKEKFGDKVIEVTCMPILPDNITIEVASGSIHEVCMHMRHDKELQYDLLSDQCGNHFEDGHFEVLYHLYSFQNNHRIRLRVKLENDKETIETISDIWATADWFEREIYDMYGIKFNNHPDMRRLLMPDYWEGHPQRKDYPLQYVPERFRENWWKKGEDGKPVLTYDFLEDKRG